MQLYELHQHVVRLYEILWGKFIFYINILVRHWIGKSVFSKCKVFLFVCLFVLKMLSSLNICICCIWYNKRKSSTHCWFRNTWCIIYLLIHPKVLSWEKVTAINVPTQFSLMTWVLSFFQLQAREIKKQSET